MGSPPASSVLLRPLPIFSQVVEDTGGLCPASVLHPTKGGPDNLLLEPQVAQGGYPGPIVPHLAIFSGSPGTGPTCVLLWTMVTIKAHTRGPDGSSPHTCCVAAGKSLSLSVH